MSDQPPIEEIAQRIVGAFRLQRIVLFGSQARGDAGPESDVDLLIEMESDLAPAERICAIDRLFTPRVWPMDVVVFTPAETARQRSSRNSLVQVAEREGRVLYERS
jgi:predicted nucleotidyltransferase